MAGAWRVGWELWEEGATGTEADRRDSTTQEGALSEATPQICIGSPCTRLGYVMGEKREVPVSLSLPARKSAGGL